jgi:hypothetical protein
MKVRARLRNDDDAACERVQNERFVGLSPPRFAVPLPGCCVHRKISLNEQRSQSASLVFLRQAARAVFGLGAGANVRRSDEIWRRSRKPPCRTNAYGRLSIYQ